MKKYIIFLTAILIGSIAFAIPDNAVNTNNSQNSTITEPDYTTVKKDNKTFYYDKYGKMIAYDKTIHNQSFFYNKVGQLTGKSIERNGTTYYYNQLGKFLGTCDLTGCKDGEFNSTGNIPPLPKIAKFVPVFDNNILNPTQKPSEEE